MIFFHFSVYLDHQQCFSNNKLHTKADVCQATLDEAVSLSFLYKVRGRFSEAWTIYCRFVRTLKNSNWQRIECLKYQV